MNAQRIKLNLIPGGIPPIVHVSQYDVGRTLEFALYDGVTAATVESGTAIDIRGTKPDKTGFSYPCTYSGNVVAVNTAVQMTAVAGSFDCELRLVKDTNEIGTANFILEVEPAALTDETIISESELPVIVEAARNNGLTEESVQKLVNSASAAANSATAAANSATAAAASETNAADSASAANTSKTAAAGSASAAATSASNAASSASSASTSASSASQSATRAQEYAAQALENATGTKEFSGSDPGLVPRSTKSGAFLRSDGQWAKMSYVGMIIHSTTLDTESKVKEFYGGTTWILHDGYMLRGASTGVSDNSAVADGGQDTVTPSGTNTGGAVKSHTLTTNEMPSHNHTVHDQYIQPDSSSGYTYKYASGDFTFINTSAQRTSSNTGGGQGHAHEFTQPTFTGKAHTNLPSYKNVYIWERTA